MFHGAMTALITPFANDAVDLSRLAANVEKQIVAGMDGLVPVGTTGESPTLSHDEHRQVIELVVEKSAGRAKVIAGTGSNATSEALQLTRFAQEIGADAALIVNPYYNKPTQEGLYRHFMAIADAVEIPIVLYNIPGRCGVALATETIVRLAVHDNIVAIKEATGSLDQASDIAASCDLTILSGDDSLTLPIMAVGGKGVISVVGNLLPDRVKALTTAALAGDFAKARELHLKLFPLCRAMLSMATNPIPIKTAMKFAGHDTGELRLPMCSMPAAMQAELEQLLRDSGII